MGLRIGGCGVEGLGPPREFSPELRQALVLVMASYLTPPPRDLILGFQSGNFASLSTARASAFGNLQTTQPGTTEMEPHQNMNSMEEDPTDSYYNDLVRYARGEKGEPPIGDFRKLHMINITHLVNQLAVIKAEMDRTQTTSHEQLYVLQQTLHKYGMIPALPIMGQRRIQNLKPI